MLHVHVHVHLGTTCFLCRNLLQRVSDCTPRRADISSQLSNRHVFARTARGDERNCRDDNALQEVACLRWEHWKHWRCIIKPTQHSRVWADGWTRYFGNKLSVTETRRSPCSVFNSIVKLRSYQAAATLKYCQFRFCFSIFMCCTSTWTFPIPGYIIMYSYMYSHFHVRMYMYKYM